MSRRRAHHAADLPSRTVHAARSGPSVQAPNRVVPDFGRRIVYVCQGAQYEDYAGFQSILRDPAGLRPMLQASSLGRIRRYDRVYRSLSGLAITDGPGADNVSFRNDAVGVTYELRFRNTVDAFREALTTPDVGVIYMGHARNGRGPCFGHADNSPGEHWNRGDGHNTGIFRMGKKWVGVPAKDIVHNNYRTDKVATLANHYLRDHRTVTARSMQDKLMRSEDCDRDILDHFEAAAANEIAPHPKTLATMDEDASHLVGNVTTTEPIHYFRGSFHEQPADCFILEAGSDDLTGITVNCRFFAHLGCSSGPHNAALFRHHVPLVDGRGYAVWTTAPASYFGWPIFVHHLVQGPIREPGDWQSPLEYAVNELNRAQHTARVSWEAYLA